MIMIKHRTTKNNNKKKIKRNTDKQLTKKNKTQGENYGKTGFIDLFIKRIQSIHLWNIQQFTS